MNVQLRHHRFSLEAYDEMIARGILTKNDRVELLAGEIVEMSPFGSRHIACVNRLNEFFILALGGRGIVSVQNSVALPPDSEPQPDILILRRRDDFYEAAHAQAHDVLLLIEVADSSLVFDRRTKLPIYAAAGVAEVWIVDLNARAIEVYSRPENREYTEKRHVAGDELALAPSAFSDVTIRARDIFGSAS